MKMHVGRRRRPSLRVLVVLAVIVVFMLFEAYRFVMPFVAKNPLYHEVTIGEPVIDAWYYGGEDQEGYLRFYDKSTGQNVVLPPTSELFGADGKFVVIEHADSGSLTFADPLEGAPPIWYVLMATFVGLALWFMIRRRKMQRKNKMDLRQASKLHDFRTSLPRYTSTSAASPKQRRFHSSKSQRPRFFR